MSYKGRVLYASLARQDNVQKVILGVDGTAAVFFAYFFELQQKSEKNKHQIYCKMTGTMPSYFLAQLFKNNRKSVELTLRYEL